MISTDGDQPSSPTHDVYNKCVCVLANEFVSRIMKDGAECSGLFLSLVFKFN